MALPPGRDLAVKMGEERLVLICPQESVDKGAAGRALLFKRLPLTLAGAYYHAEPEWFVVLPTRPAAALKFQAALACATQCGAEPMFCRRRRFSCAT